MGKIGALHRPRIREVFEQRFTARTMAMRYLAIYEQLLAA
jgi:hypothetical protein